MFMHSIYRVVIYHFLLKIEQLQNQITLHFKNVSEFDQPQFPSSLETCKMGPEYLKSSFQVESFFYYLFNV